MKGLKIGSPGLFQIIILTSPQSKKGKQQSETSLDNQCSSFLNLQNMSEVIYCCIILFNMEHNVQINWF